MAADLRSFLEDNMIFIWMYCAVFLVRNAYGMLSCWIANDWQGLCSVSQFFVVYAGSGWEIVRKSVLTAGYLPLQQHDTATSADC
jgi:hypothetical protein